MVEAISIVGGGAELPKELCIQSCDTVSSNSRSESASCGNLCSPDHHRSVVMYEGW